MVIYVDIFSESDKGDNAEPLPSYSDKHNDDSDVEIGKPYM